MKVFLAVVLLIISLLFAAPFIIDYGINRGLLSDTSQVSDQARSLHKSLTIIDLHSDVLVFGRDILKESRSGHVDLPRLQKGNVAIQAFTTVSSDDSYDGFKLYAITQFWPINTWFSRLNRTLYQAEKFDGFVANSKGVLVPIYSQSGLERFLSLRANNKNLAAGFLGIEGLHALEGNINNVEKLYDAGFRMMAFVHFFDNDLGGSSYGKDKGGITEFGKQVLKKMEDLGVMMDVSHASSALLNDILTLSAKPVLVSHTGVRGVCEHDRNLSDAQLKAIAEKGGLVGIGFFEVVLCDNTMEALVASIRYTADLVGVQHVTLGADFDGMTETIVEPKYLLLLTDALLKDGFSEEDVRLIMGGNVLKFLKENLPTDID